MKHLYLFFTIIFLLQACNLSHKAEPDLKCTIVVASNTDTLSKRAATHLGQYWEMITDKEIDIIHKVPQQKKAIYIGKPFANQIILDSLKQLKDDGFIISINKNGIWLTGNTPIANMYAVNTFLEDYLGCIKLSATEEYIPQKKITAFPDSYKEYNPDFDYRRLLFPGRKNQAYREWYKLEELDDWGMFVHTFNKLIPPEEYFEKHPEYFSLVNGRRLQDAQLCLSNPDVIKTLINNLGAEMQKEPGKNIWSVSQNDTYNYCECDNCKKLYEMYGSVSGAYIYMANQIAKAYPNKQISTLAYQFTRSAPTHIKPLPNVNIMFCSIECNRSMPLADDPRSKSFVRDMKKWSALTNNIFVWDYVVQFKNYLTPFPNFPVLQPNIQFFKQNHVDMMFEQGSGGSWSDLSELKQYLIAKLLWDTQANVDSLASNFIKIYYGPASAYIQEYYETINQEIKAHARKEFLNIYGFPSAYTDSYLSPTLMQKYKQLMDSAEYIVKQDTKYLDRVKRTRLPVDFSWVDIAINNQFEEMPVFIESESGKEINPLIIHLLDNIESYAKGNSLIRINERNLSPTVYKEYVLNKLEAMKKPNKLNQADIKVLSKYSDEYPVGGAKALNDQLFGPLDYRNNWLGFHGQDMEVEIDLKEETDIHEVQMNFLKAVNSWVFLPDTISIEYALDQTNYQKLAEQYGDNSDRGYLVKSIPFSFHFQPVKARYLRIKAKSMKSCPVWHRGYGKPSWIFIDEIIAN